MNIDHDKLSKLLNLLREASVQEFEHEDADVRVRVVMQGAQGAPQVYAVAPSIAPAAAAPQALSAGAAVDANVVDVTSPFVGTFYRASKPTAPAFVDVGARVTPGSTLCIIEAMKLMNELEAEVTGTVVEVLAENGKPVEYGQVLFRVRREG